MSANTVTSNSERRIAVKVGSNVLTRADGHLDITRMSALVDQIAELRARGFKPVLISSGAVAAGRSILAADLDHSLDSVTSRQLFSAVGQARLIQRYVELFADHKMTCGQVLATKENFSTRHHYLNMLSCMEGMLRHDVVPVVNENDTVSVTELMFTDNDELAGLVATMLRCDTLVLLTNVDGLYTGHPDEPGSRLIELVAGDDNYGDCISATRSGLGRGGMQSKYGTAKKVAKAGIDVIIANGRRDNILVDLLVDGRKGVSTRFAGAERTTSAVERWLAFSGSWSRGALMLNDGAVEAILGSGSSLLPVGVTAVEGDFKAGDIVVMRGGDGAIIGWGRAQVDAAEASQMIGRHNQPPLVIADYMYVNFND